MMRRDSRSSLVSLFLMVTLSLTQGSARPAPVGAARPAAFASGARFSASGARALVSAARSMLRAVRLPGDDLQQVLARMNEAAGGFTSAQGEFEIKTYQKVVEDTFVQKGNIYFRRTKKGGRGVVDAALRFTSPDEKQVVYKDGKLKIYEPKINQITEPDVSSNKAGVESFLSLGFGARGDDLLKDYEVTMEGWENVDGVKTAKLELVAKNERFRNTYNKIVLWIDPARDVILQQQFFESAGNYRLTHYTGLKVNERLPEDAFNLKTGPHPKIVVPR